MKKPTSDTILDAIRAASSAPRDIDSAPGVTTTEVAEAMPCSIHEARRHIRRLIAEGTMVPTRVRRVSMAGAPCEIPGYRLK